MIFIDTGAFLARYVERDQHHAKANAVWDELTREGTHCFTSNLVLSETFTLLARRAEYLFAADRARRLYSSSVLQILRPDATLEIAAIRHFEKYADQKISYCDCVSFELMRRFGIAEAFTFDHHFRVAGFGLRP